MNVLLQTLEEDGLVSRPAEAPVGRALPVKLTLAGRAQLHTASAAVKSVENRMLAELSTDERAQAGRLLRTITTSLTAQS